MRLGLSIFGRKDSRQPQTSAVPSTSGGWYPLVREAFTGAWQRNITYNREDILTYSAVYACVSLIAQDIAKLRIRLVEQDSDGVWTETTNPAYSPVLRKPNHYQTWLAFLESWLLSKLIHGNTYILKERDQRSVVVGMYVLDPQRVRVSVAPDGGVYYALGVDQLSTLDTAVIVPAIEIIHDRACTLYHPLVGVSPLTAAGLAALQGMKIQNASSSLFGNGAMPGGILFVPPVEFPDETARQNLARRWMEGFTGANAGKVAVIATDWKYESVGVNAVDAQLIDQLKWTAENVCMAFHIPPYKIGAAAPPPYNNVEALNQEYYAQALQNPIEAIEQLLDDGLALPSHLGCEFDLDALMRMDTLSRATAAEHAMKSGLSPNEVRARFYDRGPVKGGEVPFLQEQNWPIDTLAAREIPARPPTPPAPQLPAADADDDPDDIDDDDLSRAIGLALRERAGP